MTEVCPAGSDSGLRSGAQQHVQSTVGGRPIQVAAIHLARQIPRREADAAGYWGSSNNTSREVRGWEMNDVEGAVEGARFS